MVRHSQPYMTTGKTVALAGELFTLEPSGKLLSLG